MTLKSLTLKHYVPLWHQARSGLSWCGSEGPLGRVVVSHTWTLVVGVVGCGASMDKTCLSNAFYGGSIRFESGKLESGSWIGGLGLFSCCTLCLAVLWWTGCSGTFPLWPALTWWFGMHFLFCGIGPDIWPLFPMCINGPSVLVTLSPFCWCIVWDQFHSIHLSVVLMLGLIIVQYITLPVLHLLHPHHVLQLFPVKHNRKNLIISCFLVMSCKYKQLLYLNTYEIWMCFCKCITLILFSNPFS